MPGKKRRTPPVRNTPRPEPEPPAAWRFRHAGTEPPFMDVVYALFRERAARRAPSLRPMDVPAAPRQLPRLDPFELVRNDVKLPALPQVLVELQAAAADPASTAPKLARIVGRDPGLTSFVLRLVNSAYYGFPREVDTVTRAVALLGRQALVTLVSGSMVMGLFRDLPAPHCDLPGFWRHSARCAVLAREIAALGGRGDPERCFVAGLLHDVGRLAFCRLAPDHARAVDETARARCALRHNVERDLAGFDHAQLGGILLKKWNLPFPLANSVALHHKPPENADGGHNEPSIVHLADMLARALDPAEEDFPVPRPQPHAWALAGLEPGHLPGLARAADTLTEATFQVLLPRPPGPAV